MTDKATFLALAEQLEPHPEETRTLINMFAERRYSETAALAKKLIIRFPHHGFGWNALGAVLRETGRNQDALTPKRRAATLLPNDADVKLNLGNTLNDLGELEEAANSFRQAALLNPYFAQAHSQLGDALRNLGKLGAAIASSRRAIAIKPNLAEAHNHLGNVHLATGQFDTAADSYTRVTTIDSHFASAYSNLGITFGNLNRLPEAAATFRQAVVIMPQSAAPYNNLGKLLNHLGGLPEAEANFRRALEIEPNFTDGFSNMLFNQNYLANQPAAMLFAEAKKFGALVARMAHPNTAWPNSPDPARCLRVGLVSGDLRNHPVGHFIEGVLAALASHASGRLEMIAYPTYLGADALTDRIKANCCTWRPVVGLADEIVSRWIRKDGIDILIDLSGHTAHNRLPLFAWKPAPVQVTWLGYFATTGVGSIDYLIADPFTLPITEEVHFTEEIWRLPDSRLCFTQPDVDLAVSPLPASLSGHVTFCCFNNLTKINAAVVALWSRILHAVPRSLLFLKTKQLGEATVRETMLGRFAAQGIDPSRLIMEGHSPRADYLSAYHRADIALDPFPFPGGTVTAEALWMGVPVLTMTGERFLSRQGLGLLMNAGLPEWIADDADDYLMRAVTYARDWQSLAMLRAELRQKVLASPLFDAPRFARHLETALRSMWMRWCSQQQGIKGPYL